MTLYFCPVQPASWHLFCNTDTYYKINGLEADPYCVRKTHLESQDCPVGVWDRNFGVKILVHKHTLEINYSKTSFQACF